jgi:capsular exopolysaccharide synthesis family protein
MSRFDKALERARTTPAGGPAPFDVMLPEEAPAAEVFEAPWQVTDAAPTAPPAAATPRVRASGPVSRGLRVHSDLAEKVVADGGVSGPVAEQYKKLAGSLHQWQLEHGGKVVMVVSAVSSEGKTLTTLNLALTLSASYHRRVLLVDCDLRRPMLHEALQLPGHPGLADTAASGQSVVPTPVTSHLAFVAAGPSSEDPVGALTSPGFIALLEQGRADYDWIVLDTPPAAVVPDASLLNEQVDGAVLVVAARSTSFDMITRAVAAIGRERILGVVLNGVDSRDMTATDYHEYYSQR